MNPWFYAGGVAVISAAIFCATAPQREVARREIERQDAGKTEREKLEARIRQSDELLNTVRNSDVKE